MDPETKRRFDRVDEKLTTIMQVQKKQTWVTAYFLRELTGWDDKKIRQARIQGVVESRCVGKGVQYLVQSIPEEFLIKKQTA